MTIFTGNELGLTSLRTALSTQAFDDFVAILNAMSPATQADFSVYLSDSHSFITTGSTSPINRESPSEQGQFERDSEGNRYININTAVISATHSTSHPEWSLGYHVAEIVLHELGHAQDPGFKSIDSADSAQRFVAIGIRSEARAQIGAHEALASARANLLAQGTNVSASGGTLFDPSKPVTSFPATESVIRLTAQGLAIPEYANLLDDLTRDQLQEAAVALIMGRGTSHDSSGNVARGYGYFQHYASQYRGANPQLAQFFDLAENGEHRLTFDATGSSIHASMVNIQTGETTKTWEIKAFDDGSTLSIVTNRQTGEVSTFTTNTTADSGTQVVTQGNGDQTRTDYVGGKAAETTEIDGAGDNADYDTRTTTYTYDAEGRLDSSTAAMDDGTHIVIDYDQAEEHPYTRIESSTDAEGRTDYWDVFTDDGAHTWFDFDQDNTRADSLYKTEVDALGRTDWVSISADDGSSVWSDYDQDNTRADSLYQTHTDTLGRTDRVDITADDGAHIVIDYDQAGEHPYSHIQSRTDIHGRTDYWDVFTDDGGHTWFDFDQDNRRADSLYKTQTDALGRTDWVSVTADDGTSTWLDYDQDNTRADSLNQSHADAQGRTDWVDIVADDGGRFVTDYDQGDVSGTNRIESHVDASGRTDWISTTMDDGTRTLVDYDDLGGQNWQWYQSNYSANGQVQTQTICLDDNRQTRTTWDAGNESGLAYRTQNLDTAGRMDDQWAYFDDGSRLYTDYNYNGTGCNRLNGYDASGRHNYLGEQMPNGYLVNIAGQWNPNFGPAINLPSYNPNDGNYGGAHGPVDESYYLDSRNTYTDPGYEGPYYG